MKIIRHMFKAYVEGPDKIIAPRWVEGVASLGKGSMLAYDEEQGTYHKVDKALVIQKFDVDMNDGPRAA